MRFKYAAFLMELNEDPEIIEYLRTQLVDDNTETATNIMSLAKYCSMRDCEVAVTADDKSGGRIEVRYRSGHWVFRQGKQYEG